MGKLKKKSKKKKRKSTDFNIMSLRNHLESPKQSNHRKNGKTKQRKNSRSLKNNISSSSSMSFSDVEDDKLIKTNKRKTANNRISRSLSPNAHKNKLAKKREKHRKRNSK